MRAEEHRQKERAARRQPGTARSRSAARLRRLEIARFEEEYGAAFCFALNRLRLQQEGFRLQMGRHDRSKADGAGPATEYPPGT